MGPLLRSTQVQAASWQPPHCLAEKLAIATAGAIHSLKGLIAKPVCFSLHDDGDRDCRGLGTPRWHSWMPALGGGLAGRALSSFVPLRQL